jgi:hypothetical protein
MGVEIFQNQEIKDHLQSYTTRVWINIKMYNTIEQGHF